MNKYIYIIISVVFCTQKSAEIRDDKAKMKVNVTHDSSNEYNFIKIKHGKLIFKDTLVNNFRLVKFNDSEVVFVTGHSNTFRMTALYAIVNNIIEKKVFVLDRVNITNELLTAIEIFPYVVRNKLKIIDDNGRNLLEQELQCVGDNLSFEYRGSELSIYNSDTLFSRIDLTSVLH